MKMVLNVDKTSALKLAQEFENRKEINAVAFKYNTKKGLFKKE